MLQMTGASEDANTNATRPRDPDRSRDLFGVQLEVKLTIACRKCSLRLKIVDVFSFRKIVIRKVFRYLAYRENLLKCKRFFGFLFNSRNP